MGRADGVQLAIEIIEEFYNRAYKKGYEEAQLKIAPEGSFSYRQGYVNGRRDQKFEDSNFEEGK